MVLRYMISDTDLAKGEFVQPEKEPAQPIGEPVQLKQSMASPKRRVKVWLLLAASMILCGVVYYLWTTHEESRALGFIGANRLTITGIIYNAENPSAIICGKVVHEGETINGCKVVKINKRKVEFEKNGNTFRKRVR
ncbi:MAG: hypothetical protein ACYS83_01335 [Planctomycetota bacterium]